MINVVLMRHGDAEALRSSDQERQLTALGVEEVQCMASYLNAHDAPFDYVISSPYLRACQTADLMVAQQSPLAQRLQVTELVPEADAADAQLFLDALLTTAPSARVLVVSHMPLLSFLTEKLSRPGVTPIFATAGCALFQYQAGRGEFVKMLAPAAL
jgi:phosphohistidine phosphatase